MCDEWEVVGDVTDEEGRTKTEEVELWRRNPVNCIRELIGNPVFKKHLKYAPEMLSLDEDGMKRMYDEMWTGEWWWDLQVSTDPFRSKL